MSGVAGPLVAALVLGVIAWMFSAPPEAAAALAPDQTGWWNTSNQNGLAAPAPPDVDTSKHDLFVEGFSGTGGPNPAPLPQNNAQGGAQALAAIHFSLQDGAAVEKLTLTLGGNKPPGTPSVVACAITAPTFKAEDNGPVEDIPKYDCGVQSPGQLSADGNSFVFSDIGHLTRGSSLSVMLVPGQLDRVVFQHPDASSLQVSSGFTQPAPLPQYTAPPAYVAPADTSSSFSIPPPVAAPFSEIPLPAPLPTRAPAVGTRPVARAGAPATLVGPRIPLNPQQTRLVVGAATLASIAAFVAMALMGPRLAGAAGAPAGAEALRGVGRFARPRDGRAPEL
ncbi:MAG: hypothetical protein QOK05_895 [Chloroflexota bacterium]|nr:hypothetical protein [Chloroflexota bacterium]